MHELNSAQSVLTKALLKICEASAKRIKCLWRAIGEISELDQSSIQKHWEELSQGKPAEHAQLHFRLKKAEVQSMACFTKYHPADGKIHCPYRGSYGAKILSGEEFYLELIELNDE
jgi:Zn finger protein HypA/HybF involved in hydrogenase expression